MESSDSFTEGELSELIEELNDGKVQFAFVKVKDSNSGLAKFVFIAWVRVKNTQIKSQLLSSQSN